MEAGLAGEGRQVEMEPRLYVIIPCYNEEQVLPIMAPLFLQQLLHMAAKKKISADSSRDFAFRCEKE